MVFKSLSRNQKLYILTGLIISFFLAVGSIIMSYLYVRLTHVRIIGQNQYVAVRIILGWCLLMYICYVIVVVILENVWVDLNDPLENSDITLTFTNIKVFAFLYILIKGKLKKRRKNKTSVKCNFK